MPPSGDVPPQAAPSSLIISDGGVGALLAAWTEGVCAPIAAGSTAPPPGPVLWFPLAAAMLAGETIAGSRLAAARRQAELCHASELIVSESHASLDTPDAVLKPAGFLHTHLLLAAAAEAARRGIPRVIWPVHLGGPADREALDLHAVADACDRALLVGQLLLIDLRGGREVRVETPFVDFTDLQVAELALDLDVPRPIAMGASWCDATGQGAGGRWGCGACAECRRWQTALLAAGGEAWLVDPGAPAVTIGARGEPSGKPQGGTLLRGVSA